MSLNTCSPAHPLSLLKPVVPGPLPSYSNSLNHSSHLPDMRPLLFTKLHSQTAHLTDAPGDSKVNVE